ncbi:hypothetical protein Tco_0175964 [Tanacetum coccineum]
METMNVTFDELTKYTTEGQGRSWKRSMHDDYIGGQPSAAPRTTSATPEPQVLQTLMAYTTIADTTSTPTNSSSQDAHSPNTSQDIDEL